MAEKRRVDNKGRKLPDGFSQRPDGRYMERFTFEGERYTLYDLNLRKLKEKVNEKKYELQNGVACKSSNVTLNERYDYWVETYYCKKVKLSTLTSRDEYYKRYVFPEFGKNRMQKIKQADIIVFYSTLKNQVIVSENLQIKNMVKNHHLAKTISDVSWYRGTS